MAKVIEEGGSGAQQRSHGEKEGLEETTTSVTHHLLFFQIFT